MKTTVTPEVALEAIRRAYSEEGRIVVIPGSSLYFVSSTGHVYSVWSKAGSACRALRLRTMKHSGGYPQVQVYRNGRRKPVRIHTLVAEAFLPPPGPGQTMIRHEDDNPDNNCCENLLWGTQVENSQDAKRNGRQMGRPSVYSDDIVRAVRAARTAGATYQAVANTYGVSLGFVYDVTSNRKRKGVE